jgi:hypothetical protein
LLSSLFLRGVVVFGGFGMAVVGLGFIGFSIGKRRNSKLHY